MQKFKEALKSKGDSKAITEFKFREEVKKFFEEDEHEMNEMIFLSKNGSKGNMLDFGKKDILMRKDERRRQDMIKKLGEKSQMRDNLLKRRKKKALFTSTRQKVIVRKTHYALTLLNIVEILLITIKIAISSLNSRTIFYIHCGISFLNFLSALTICWMAFKIKAHLKRRPRLKKRLLLNIGFIFLLAVSLIWINFSSGDEESTPSATSELS